MDAARKLKVRLDDYSYGKAIATARKIEKKAYEERIIPVVLEKL